MKKLLYILIITFCFKLTANSQSYSNSWKDINYVGDTLISHRMDVYLPNVIKPQYPTIVIIYGSAFLRNDLKQKAYEILGATLLDSGFAVVSVNHQSSKDAIFPAQINDIKAAVRYIRANGEKFQLDTSFIGITGYSSGGHLSALMGTSGKVEQKTINDKTAQIEGELGSYLSFSSSVDAVVDWFGPTDFLSMDSCGSTLVHDSVDSPESILIGGPIQNNHDLCALANPISYIDINDPPFFIFHGDTDPLVPHCQSEMLHQSLQGAGVASQFVLVPKGGHGSGLFEKKYFGMMTDFFIRIHKEKNKGK